MDTTLPPEREETFFSDVLDPFGETFYIHSGLSKSFLYFLNIFNIKNFIIFIKVRQFPILENLYHQLYLEKASSTESEKSENI